MKSILAAGAVALTLAAQPAGAQIDLSGSTRLFDLVDLSTPDAAVAAYVEAFAADDFPLAFLILDPVKAEQVVMAARLFDFGVLSNLSLVDCDCENWPVAREFAETPDSPFLTHSPMQLFTYLMELSDYADAHLIDFPAPEGALTVGTVGEPFEAEDRTRAEVAAEITGIGPVHFLMQRSPAGHWRLLSITARPGGADAVAFLPMPD